MSSTIWISIMLDLIVVGLIVLGASLGYIKGFMKTAYHLVSWILSFILTKLFYPFTVRFLKLTSLSNTISAGIGKFLSLPTVAAESAQKTISGLNIPSGLKQSLLENNNYEVYEILGVNSLNEYIQAFLTNMVINAMAILITFLVVILLIKLAAVLMDIVDKLPVLHALNHALGLIFGLLNGVIYVFIFCLVLTLLGAFEPMAPLYPAISGSLLTNLFYNNNILLESLLKIFSH